MRKFLGITSLLLFLPILAEAHGVATTLTQETDEYLIEFEYNSLSNVKANGVAIYTVHLLNPDNREPVVFDSAYIKISSQRGEPILFGTLKQASDLPGSTRIGGVLKDSGEHTAQVQFTKDDKLIGPFYFKFTVDSEIAVAVREKWPRYYVYIPGGLGLIVLAVASLMKLKQKKKTTL